MSHQKKKKYGFRKLMNDLHLWLGVSSSLILFIVCFTGTVYVFKPEIEEFLEPEKYQVANVLDQKISLDELAKNTAKETQGEINRITFTTDETRTYEINVKTNPENRRGETFLVDPYTGEIKGGTKGVASEFFMTMFKLHRWLMLDAAIGRPVVGVATIIFILLGFSGFFLWLPKKIKGFKSFKPGLKIKWNANWKRINHDLHVTLSFYSLILIMLMAFSGLFWSFDWYKKFLSVTLDAQVGKYPAPSSLKNGEPEKKSERKDQEKEKATPNILISYEEALQIAQKELPYKGQTTISSPEKSGVYKISKNNENRLNATAFDQLSIDAETGKVTEKVLFADYRTGEKIAKQIKAIHMGTIYGTFSKWLYFIACLIATSLPITGIFIWLNKMKKKPKK
ncbi:MAG TPA: PepSY-associated TM helix domain-containing protein [Flavobacterium sp.]|nr:PepSY-associated TM helix domain-containing protein [Flavobacterium sp.]